MRDEVILRVGSKVLAPFIIAFALYVQYHGDIGPGGAFQAGVIMAAAFVLLCLVYGVEAVQRVMPAGVAQSLAAFGVLIYAGVGVVTMLLGENYLDYDAFGGHDGFIGGQHWGILGIEHGVFLTVFGVMTSAFYLFVERAGRER